MSSTIQFVGINPNDLITELKNSLIPELTAQLTAKFQPIQPTEYLTRSEVCKLLKIDLSTLHRWRKDNVIPSYGMQNRVYFKRNEVEQLINQNKLS
ncbi:helix-turn-helix domain-containing protein [Elizabethkingia anophelis]|nr:helix-turn-helix domain-containing protein [Elizabethkingia anophelis]